jgi:hypothetical protein
LISTPVCIKNYMSVLLGVGGCGSKVLSQAPLLPCPANIVKLFKCPRRFSRKEPRKANTDTGTYPVQGDIPYGS